MKRLFILILMLSIAVNGYCQKIDDGRYIIESTIDYHYVITLQNGKVERGANICISKYGGTANQKWEVLNNDDGTISIHSSINTNYVLDLYGSQLRRGTNIHLWDSNGTNAQKWYLLHDGDGYRIRSAYNVNWVIDLNSSLTKDGNNIQLWDSNGSDAQLWKFVPVDNDEELLEEFYMIYGW